MLSLYLLLLFYLLVFYPFVYFGHFFRLFFILNLSTLFNFFNIFPSVFVYKNCSSSPPLSLSLSSNCLCPANTSLPLHSHPCFSSHFSSIYLSLPHSPSLFLSLSLSLSLTLHKKFCPFLYLVSLLTESCLPPPSSPPFAQDQWLDIL